MNHSACILCNSKEISDLRGYERHQLSRCGNCNFVFMSRIPTNDDLIAHYRLYSYASNSVVSPLTVMSYHQLLDRLEPYRKFNNIIDIGCGKGWFLLEAKKRGWNVYGTEFSEEAIKICTLNGINVFQGDLNSSSFESMKFDVVFSSEVIEHVNNPVQHFRSMFDVLRPGGLVYITTPNFNCYLRFKFKANYNIIEYPEHLGYFTKRTLHRGLTKVGFSKLKMLTTGVSISRAEFSKGPVESVANAVSKDEKLRTLMSENRLMRFVKKMANFVLTITGLGITLKAFYKKPI